MDWFGTKLELAATDPGWVKWCPSDPTSPHWYDEASLERLLTGYIAHDQECGAERTLRQVVAEFDGLTGTAKQKKVLAETALARTRLSGLVKGRSLRPGVVGALLAAMQKHAKPVKPKALGTIGRPHFERRFAEAGCVMESFAYSRQFGHTADGRPWIIETAFGMLADQAARRRLITGVNWSPGIVNPFRSLGACGRSCDTVLANQRIDGADPVILVLHTTCPKPQYTDRGKSAVVLED